MSEQEDELECKGYAGHTELPWRQSMGTVFAGEFGKGLQITKCFAMADTDQDEINAAFIVLAANAHKNLLDLAKNIARGVDIDQGAVMRLVDEIAAATP